MCQSRLLSYEYFTQKIFFLGRTQYQEFDCLYRAKRYGPPCKFCTRSVYMCSEFSFIMVIQGSISAKNPKATELLENFFTFLTNRHFPLWLHIHKNKRPFVATKRPKKKVVFVGLIWAILQRSLNNSAHSHRIAHKKISQSPKGI